MGDGEKLIMDNELKDFPLRVGLCNQATIDHLTILVNVLESMRPDQIVCLFCAQKFGFLEIWMNVPEEKAIHQTIHHRFHCSLLIDDSKHYHSQHLSQNFTGVEEEDIVNEKGKENVSDFGIFETVNISPKCL